MAKCERCKDTKLIENKRGEIIGCPECWKKRSKVNNEQSEKVDELDTELCLKLIEFGVNFSAWNKDKNYDVYAIKERVRKYVQLINKMSYERAKKCIVKEDKYRNDSEYQRGLQQGINFAVMQTNKNLRKKFKQEE